MLAWEVIETSLVFGLDNLQLATILNGKIDQSLLNYPGLIEERRKEFNEVLKKIASQMDKLLQFTPYYSDEHLKKLQKILIRD